MNATIISGRYLEVIQTRLWKKGKSVSQGQKFAMAAWIVLTNQMKRTVQTTSTATTEEAPISWASMFSLLWMKSTANDRNSATVSAIVLQLSLSTIWVMSKKWQTRLNGFVLICNCQCKQKIRRYYFICCCWFLSAKFILCICSHGVPLSVSNLFEQLTISLSCEGFRKDLVSNSGSASAIERVCHLYFLYSLV